MDLDPEGQATCTSPRFAAVWRASGRSSLVMSDLSLDQLVARIDQLDDAVPIGGALGGTLGFALSERAGGGTDTCVRPRPHRVGHRLLTAEPSAGSAGSRWIAAFGREERSSEFLVAAADEFLATHRRYTAREGLRLEGFSTHVDADGRRCWSGVWHEGDGDHALVLGVDWEAFTAAWEELAADGLRLHGIETYVADGLRRWAGFFRAGTGAYVLWQGGWAEFVATRDKLARGGLRLVDVATYVEGGGRGERQWVGVFLQGHDAHAFLADLPLADFEAENDEMRRRGLHLVQVTSYP